MRILAIIIMLLAFVAGCSGEYDEALKNGTHHACALKAVMEKAGKDTPNKETLEEIERLTRYIQIQRDLSGDADKFNKDLGEATAKCK